MFCLDLMHSKWKNTERQSVVNKERGMKNGLAQLYGRKGEKNETNEMLQAKPPW